MAAFGPPLGYLAAPSKRRPKFVQPLGSTSLPEIGATIDGIAEDASQIIGDVARIVWLAEEATG